MMLGKLLQRMFRSRLKVVQNSGEWGEAQAASHLKSSGWKILGKRVRSGNREEIDIIAREGDVLVFVEVKTRSSERFGSPVQAVNARKRRLLSKAAARYLAGLKNPRVYFRFDVVEVLGNPESGLKDIRHLRNVFTLDKRYTI